MAEPYFVPRKRRKRWVGGEGAGCAARRVYLSHGNWFAGAEVGSFEKTLTGLTPSHLSVWKCAEREGWREVLLLLRHFHTKERESECV